MTHSAENDAHRRVVNLDSIDTCTGCEWEGWDTAPTFAEHVIPPDMTDEVTRDG